MHYIDELLALYNGRDLHTRRYLLSGASVLPLSFDTDTLIELLWRETASPDASVRHQARRELGRLLPEFVLAESGMHEMRSGVWTAFRGKADRERARLELQLAAMTREEADRLVTAGAELFSPFLPRLAVLVKSGSNRLKAAATLVLGRMPCPAAADLIKRLIGEEPGNFLVAAAAAELAHPSAPSLVRAALAAGVRQEPDLVALTSALTEEDRLPVLEQIEGAGPQIRWNIGQALAGATTDRGRTLVERLVKRHEGWTTAYALDAVASRARERDLAIAELAYAQESHEFLKVQAVKLAGHVIAPKSVDFLLARLADGTPRVQAAALEAMVRQDAPPKEFFERAEALLASPLLRARVNAMMVLGRSHPERVMPALRELLFSDQAVHRLEAAYVLGYASGLEAVAALAEVAASDPVAPVQMQALKSLAKHPAPISADHVLGFIRSPDPRLAATAVRAAVHQVSQAPNIIHDGLVRVLAEIGRSPVEGVLLRAIGSATARRGSSGTPQQLVDALASPQSAVVQGALEGLKHLGDHGFPAEARALLTHADVSVRTRTALAGFLAGELDVVQIFSQPLETGDEKAALSALSRMYEALVMLPDAIRSARFNKLREALGLKIAQAPAGPAPAPPAKLAPEPSRPPESLQQPQWRPIKAPMVSSDNTKLKEIYSGKQRKHSQRSVIEPRKIEDTSLMVGFPTLADVRAKVQPYRSLVAAVALLCVPLVFWIFHTDADEPGVVSVKGGKLPAGTLRATFLQGAAKLATGGKESPLVLGTDVGPGATVSTEAKGALTLDDGAGSSLWMGGGGHVTIAAPVEGASFVFRDPAGDMHLAFKKVSGFEMHNGPARIVGHNATFRLMDSGGVPHVVPGEGELTLTRGDKTTHLEKGRPLPFH